MTTDKNRDMLKVDTLTKAQKNFLDFCLKLGYGKLEVIVKDGEPVSGVKKEELIKFD